MLNNRRPGARISPRIGQQQAAVNQVQAASSSAVLIDNVAQAMQAGDGMDITYDPVLRQILFDAGILP